MSGGPPDPPPPHRIGTGTLVIFGLVLVQPIAPIPIFGLVERHTGGHATLALLIAMAAMLLTATSYGRMAAAHPRGGSAYTYASRELRPWLGFLAGWAMGLDYLLIPVISALYAALTLARFFALPVPVTLAAFIILLTLVNLAGARISFRANAILLALMLAAVSAFISCALAYLVDPASTRAPGATDLTALDPRALWRGTALISLTYLGFDGVSTLADDARDPARTIPRATLLVVLITGLLGALEIGLAHAVWPDHTLFVQLETAFLDVTARVGGRGLYAAMTATLVLAAAGTFLSAQAGAARLLLAMGRDGALPRWPFAVHDRRRGGAPLNLILLAVLAAVGASCLRFDQAAELVNFGAFVAFLSVNAATIAHALRSGGKTRRRWARALPPALGFTFCAAIGLGLSATAQIAGAIWLAVGAVLVATRPRPPTRVNDPASDTADLFLDRAQGGHHLAHAPAHPLHRS